MKAFMDKDFMLQSATAQHLYHDYAAAMPICDYHCHIPPREIYENRRFENITPVWLGGRNPDGSYSDGTTVAATVPQSQAQTGTGSASSPSSGARVKNGIIANFRSGPGSEYGVIAELEPGTPVKIISVAGNWYFCEVNGLQGYLHPSCVAGF